MAAKKIRKLKICLIGNSHSGCFKTGWDFIGEKFKNVDIKFYPHSGEFFHFFEADTQESLLRMKNDFVREQFERISGGDGNINFKEFDYCIIVGGINTLSLFSNRFYSEQVVESLAADYYESSHVSVLVKKIREISNIKLLLVPSPNAALRKRVTETWSSDRSKINELINKNTLAKIDATLLLPPEEVWEKNCSRFKLKYAAGERETGASLVPANERQIIDDLVHMNAAYGALFLIKILDDLGCKAKAIVLPEADGHLSFQEKRNTRMGETASA